MCIVSSQAWASHQLWKLSHLKNNELSKPQIYKVSKGVSKIVLKFPLEVIFRTRNYGTLLVASLFLHNSLLEISVELISCRESRQPWSIYSLPASQVEAIKVEIFLGNQGSRKVNMEESSIVYSSLVRARNLQILRIEQGSTPRIDQSFLATLLFIAIANVKRCTLSFSRSPPSWSVSLTVEPRHRQCSDRATPRHHSIILFRNRAHDAKTSRADHCRAPCCLHQIPGWLNDRYNAAAVIKGNPLPRTAEAKAPFPSELDIATALVLPPDSLGHCTSPSLPSVPFLTKQVVLRLRPPSRRSSEVDRKKNSSQAATHDSVFGRVWVFLLDVGRDVSLYRRRNLSAISCACAHSSPASSWTAMR
jgi:hypothetical protein